MVAISSCQVLIILFQVQFLEENTNFVQLIASQTGEPLGPYASAQIKHLHVACSN